MACGASPVPLTPFQQALGRLLAPNRTEDSFLAGGAVILTNPQTKRYSHDLDYFHDSPARVASAFAADNALLGSHGFSVSVEITQPGYIRAIVRGKQGVTKIEWSYDSSWRFMPAIRDDLFGFALHPIDVATNKVLALAGRDEIRDVVDAVFLHQNVLELGPLAWAAMGKDPGYSPSSLLEMLKRRGKIRPEELAHLHLAAPIDPQALKAQWLDALESAATFIQSRPPEEAGCLYYSLTRKQFVDPNQANAGEVVPHFGRPGGVLPRFAE